jgi:Zn-dependent protease
VSAPEKQPSALERLRQLDAGKAASPQAARTPARKHRGPIGAALAFLALILVKTKGAIFLFLGKAHLLLAGLKLGKFVTTGWTMALMAWVYASREGWPFAVGLVLLILVHEMGHGLAARAVGIRVGAPIFIPFFGAFIALKEQPRSTWQEFLIAAGGPIAGSAAAAAVLVASTVAGDAARLLQALGFFGLVMNLFNLTPFWTLDGARMLAPVAWRPGLTCAIASTVLLVAIAATTGHLNPIAAIAVAVALWRFGSRWRAERRDTRSALERLVDQDRAASAVPDAADPLERRIALAVYFGILAALTVAVHVLFNALPPP